MSEYQDRLATLDFEKHNAEVRATWDAYYSGAPIRVPIIFGTNTRYFMKEPTANVEGMDFRRYSENPDLMFETQLQFQRWNRFNLLQDGELGLPERWGVWPDFQNYYEAAWFGCKVEYRDGEVPDAVPTFAENPESVMDAGLPDPFGGLMGRSIEYWERFKELAENQTFQDRPINCSTGTGMGTDGVMTVACCLFGPEFVCATMASDPERLHRLFDFITEATILRMKAWRDRFGGAYPHDGFIIADDSIALVSTKMYREHILPYHRKVYDTFGTEKGRSIHLCGDSTRHFLTLRDELKIIGFDTGFPIDFGEIRKRMGPEIRINGGPHVELLRGGTPDQIREEVRRILRSGILEGGWFVLREGNNLAPLTPLENTEAMYEAGKYYGRYESSSAA